MASTFDTIVLIGAVLVGVLLIAGRIAARPVSVFVEESGQTTESDSGSSTTSTVGQISDERRLELIETSLESVVTYQGEPQVATDTLDTATLGIDSPYVGTSSRTGL